MHRSLMMIINDVVGVKITANLSLKPNVEMNEELEKKTDEYIHTEEDYGFISYQIKK